MQTWRVGHLEDANGASVYEVVAVVTVNGTPDRKGFFLGVLLGGGASSSVELNSPIASV